MEIYFRTFKKAFKNVRRKYKRPRKLFVILNPYGGSGNASKIWNSIAKPVLELAGIRITTVRTQRPKHAYEICLDLDLELYDGLVTIGGDGILNECVHALAERKEQGQFEKSPIPVGLIPAGSYNCINQVTSGTVSVSTTSLQIISGKTWPS